MMNEGMRLFTQSGAWLNLDSQPYLWKEHWLIVNHVRETFQSLPAAVDI